MYRKAADYNGLLFSLHYLNNLSYRYFADR